MMTGIEARVCEGYTGCDHLIGDDARTAATDAVAGQSFTRARDALRAAQRAFLSQVPAECASARIIVALRNERGDQVEVSS